jgi:hemerythrin-like domain-containing protein
MDPIDVLMQEHQVILRVIDAAEAFASEVDRTGHDGRAELADFVTFIREYADARHHGKEEDILFEAMQEVGFSTEAGPLAVMLHEHTEGRRLVREMAEAAATPAPWTPAERSAVVGAVESYAALLRNHIWKEDNILYPAAQNALDETAYGVVAQRIKSFDGEWTAKGKLSELDALAEKLIARAPRA